MKQFNGDLLSKLPQANRLPQVDTVKRVNRQVVITTTSTHLIVGFYWREIVNGVMSDIHDTSFEYPIGITLDSVERAINFFFHGGVQFAIEQRNIIVCSSYIDDLAEKFDLVANAEEPQNALVSRYII